MPTKTLSEDQRVQMTAKAARKLREAEQTIEALQRLAEAFPVLDSAQGVDPWNPEGLQTWSDTAPPSAKHAARFVLSVAEPEETAFDLHAALAEWSELERTAFNAWSSKPWWA